MKSITVYQANSPRFKFSNLKQIRVILMALLLLGIFSQVALACDSFYQSRNILEIVLLPSVVVLSTVNPFLPALLPIAIIEFLFLWKKGIFNISKALLIATLANLSSVIYHSLVSVVLLLGFPNFFGVVITGVMNCLVFSLMLNFLCRKTNLLPNLAYSRLVKKIGLTMIIFLFSLGWFILTMFILETVKYSRDPIVLYFVIFSVLFSGFIFNLVIKGCLIANICQPEKHPNLAQTIVTISVASLPLYLLSSLAIISSQI